MNNNGSNDLTNQSDNISSSLASTGAFPGAFPLFDFSSPYSSLESLGSSAPARSLDQVALLSEPSTSYSYSNNSDIEEIYDYPSSSVVSTGIASRKRPLQKLHGSLNGAPSDDEVSLHLKMPIPGRKILESTSVGKGKKRSGGHLPSWAISYGMVSVIKIQAMLFGLTATTTEPLAFRLTKRCHIKQALSCLI
jgi:hypothetical protein